MNALRFGAACRKIWISHFYIFDDGYPNTPVQRFRDWSRNCLEGFSSPGHHYLVFAQSYGLAMQRYGLAELTMPVAATYNEHGHPPRYRAMDMRASGKSFHLEVFGVFDSGAKPSDIDLHTYPGLNVSGSPTGDYSVYLMEPHLFFATGGSYLTNWVWKDTAHVIFPWGVTNANDNTPLGHPIAYRDESYFLGHFQPQFDLPKVLVVISKAHLMKDEESLVPHLNGTMDARFVRAIQFAVIDDVDLDRLPNEPHILIYPDPEYASKEVLTRLRSRVLAGDDLFLTGDFTQPLERGGERQTGLFDELVGLRWLADYPAGSEIAIVPVEGEGLLNPYLGHPLSKFQAEGARAPRIPQGMRSLPFTSLVVGMCSSHRTRA